MSVCGRYRNGGILIFRAVAICGLGAEGWIEHLNAPGTEVWSLNSAHEVLRQVKFHRYFELHRRAYLQQYEESAFTARIAWMRTLKRHDVPVYTWEIWPECKTNRLYPKAEVEALTPHGRYHLSSIDWMIAAAILWGYETIRLYGIRFEPGSEPIGARACAEYWLGVAEARGIGVEVFGNNCDLFQTTQLLRSHKQYGVENVHLIEHVDDLPKKDQRVG